MNSPAVTRFTPSTQPALELIALARLSPELARQKLRALLLSNPNYFGRVPSVTFNTVLNIKEDTTYECISRVSYDPVFNELRASIDIKQPFGYSHDVLVDGSKEFVRFYVSYDGGLNWLDQGVRSIEVFDAGLPRPLVHNVSLKNLGSERVLSSTIPSKVRAILSWNSPPPAGSPNWIPVWGNVVQSDIQINDSQADMPGTLHSEGRTRLPNTARHVTRHARSEQFDSTKSQGHPPERWHLSSKIDPQHSFLAYVLAKAARYSDAEIQRIDTVRGLNLAPAVPPAVPAEPVFAGVS